MTARDLPPLPPGDAYTADLHQLVAAVNGFVYAGDGFDTVLATVQVLRADPDLAARLLAGGTNPEPRS